MVLAARETDTRERNGPSANGQAAEQARERVPRHGQDPLAHFAFAVIAHQLANDFDLFSGERDVVRIAIAHNASMRATAGHVQGNMP